MKKIIPKIASVLLSATMLLTGCSFEKDVHKTESYEFEHEWAEGDYHDERNAKGIPIDAEDFMSRLSSGEYYILHDGKFYPTYGYKGVNALGLKQSSSKSRFTYFPSDRISKIPTLFEGDKLYYYSASGVYDYTILERFKEWGWTVGIEKMNSNTTGHVYVNVPTKEDVDNGDATNPFFSPEFIDIYDHIGEDGGSVLIDKIGGTQFTSDFIKDGKIWGLKEGAPYDFELYKGTNYFYYHASANYFFLQGFESYALWEYTSLQDYLYEIEVPDYLLDGYYWIDGKGMIRIVRGDYYNEETDFNVPLLYSDYPPGDYTDEELAELEANAKMPGMYSENPILNSFHAYDSSCFGWVDDGSEEDVDDSTLKMNEELEAAFLEASTTVTPIWLPQGQTCKVSIITTEKTGKVMLKTADEKKRDVPYDRISGSYTLEIPGNDTKASIIVQGLYKDYTIKLSGCETYKNQDSQVTIDESLPDNTAGQEEDTGVENEVPSEEPQNQEEAGDV